MHPAQRLDALVAPFREDVVSGAAERTRSAADVLLQAVEDSPGSGRPVPGGRGGPTHPGRAARHGAPRGPGGHRPARGRGSGQPPPTRAGASQRPSRPLLRESGSGHRSWPRAAPALPADGDVLTLSSSSTVLQTLLHVRNARRGRVVVLESRPAAEGRDMAQALAEAGVPVRFAVDAAVATLVPTCAAVLLGADSIGDRGVVNKVGSLAAAVSAERPRVPVLVVADSSEIIPPGFPQHLTGGAPGGAGLGGAAGRDRLEPVLRSGSAGGGGVGDHGTGDPGSPGSSSVAAERSRCRRS